MMEKLKSLLSLLSGWAAALALGALWLLSRPRARPVPVRVEPKKVPDDPNEVKRELRKRGLIK